MHVRGPDDWGDVGEDDAGGPDAEGTSDPQLWVYLTQGGPVWGMTSQLKDTTEPIWPPDETICVDPSLIHPTLSQKPGQVDGRTPLMISPRSPPRARPQLALPPRRPQICIDIREDNPQPEPYLLNFKCVDLPTTFGEHERQLDNGCTVRFVAIAGPPPSPAPPPPIDLSGKLNAAKCSAMLNDPHHLFRKMWNAQPWRFRHRYDATPTLQTRAWRLRAADLGRPLGPRVAPSPNSASRRTTQGGRADVLRAQARRQRPGAARTSVLRRDKARRQLRVQL